ncbi:MAG TPA: YIP1 family protein [Pseudogracilibacillus sp.]|nr:YIP1 family protein [Pseudogracilibacillus sp.]
MSEETETVKPSLIGIITSPVQQLERIKGRTLVWSPIITVIIMVIIGSVLQGLSAEMPGIEEDVSNTPFMVILGAFTVALTIVGTLIGVLIVSAIHMLIAKIALSTVSFKQLFSMNTYIAIITALGILINGIVAAVIGTENPEALFTSVGSFVNASGDVGMLSGLWDSIEIFAIWAYIVTAFGLQIVAGFSKKLAWSIVLAFFLITILFNMISAFFSGMAGV